ncbi:MAG: type II secretion system protein GspN [Thermodesulfobacteriota bacterium]
MRLFRNKLFFFFSLLVYTLLLTGGLLYFRFPAETFRLYCQTQIDALLPNASCSIQKLQYRFPLALQVDELRFSSTLQKGQELATVDQTIIRPDLSSPTSRFQVTLKACEGSHAFTLVVDPDTQQFALEDIQLTDLNLAEFPFLQQTLGRDVTGSLSGTGSYQGGWQQDGAPGKGQGNLVVSEGSFSLLLPIFSLNSIDLKKMSSELVLENNRLRLAKGNFQGKELMGAFSGDIALKHPLTQAPLTFKGTLEPLPPLLKTSKYARDMIRQLKKHKAQATLPFVLSGKVGSPKFKIDS